MVELALEAHSSILVESFHTKEAEKRIYISKCVEDIRKVRDRSMAVAVVGCSLIPRFSCRVWLIWE